MPSSPLNNLKDLPKWVVDAIKITIKSETATTAGRFNLIGWFCWLIFVIAFSSNDYLTPLVNGVYGYFKIEKVEEIPMWFILLSIFSLPASLIWCVSLIIKSEIGHN
jgi:hypothetical protein